MDDPIIEWTFYDRDGKLVTTLSDYMPTEAKSSWYVKSWLKVPISVDVETPYLTCQA